MILKTFLFNQTCLYVQRLYSVPIFIAKTNCCPQWGQKKLTWNENWNTCS